MSISPDKLREQMEQTITAMLPTISEELKSRVKLELKKQFSSGLEEEKGALESSLKELNSKEAEILKTIKGELDDIKKEISVEKADALKVITKNVSELCTKLGLNPKLTNILLSIPTLRDGIAAEVALANKAWEDLKVERAKATKDKHEITIKATNLILAIVITAISVLYTIVQLIMIIKG